MKLILAQGNPGPEYKNTRHNIGFQLLDAYVDRTEGSFLDKSKFFASLAEVVIGGEKIILAKPSTFYNETGRSARALVDFYKLQPETDVLVIHDDISLPLGTVRTREKGSDAGNNGIKSLNMNIGDAYKRLRIGTSTELSAKVETSSFVLAPFTFKEEQLIKDHVQPIALEVINAFIAGRFSATSHAHKQDQDLN